MTVETPIQPRTISEISARFPAFSEGALRWAIFCSKAPAGTRQHDMYGGLRPAIIRIGRRVLIDETRFLRWIAARQQS